MATKAILQELTIEYKKHVNIIVDIQSVGGVEATKRVEQGEYFDFVVLSSDALEKLVECGRILPQSKVDVALSDVALAVKDCNKNIINISTPEALRSSLLGASRIGYSTGPSGIGFLKLLASWSLLDPLSERLIMAPPGTPVGRLIAEGAVDIGIQQFSELKDVPGISIVGFMPDSCKITSTFSAAVCSATKNMENANDFIEFISSPSVEEIKVKNGMHSAKIS